METTFVLAWLILFPALIAWWARYRAKAWHVVVLLVVAALAAVAAVGLLSAARGVQALNGAVLLAIAMYAGMLAIAALSGGLALALFGATRSEQGAARAEALRIRRGDPKRPSLKPFSPREWSERTLISTIAASLLFGFGFVSSCVAGGAPNFLRAVGLFRDPAMRELSMNTTPGPFLLQTGLAGLLAIGFAVWAWIEFRRSR